MRFSTRFVQALQFKLALKSKQVAKQTRVRRFRKLLCEQFEERRLLTTNNPPVAFADAYLAIEDVALSVGTTGVLSNDTDANGDSLTAFLVTQGSKGTVVLNPNGSFVYTANPNENGFDEFTYKVSDGTTWSNTATASISIASINDAPVLDSLGQMSLSTLSMGQSVNQGQSVASIIASAGGDRITDADVSSLEGIAIFEATGPNGTWAYSINNGSTWTNFGSVSSTSSLLLRSVDLVRFTPILAGANGQISFRAWDQTSGATGSKVSTLSNGGATAFSSSTETAQINVDLADTLADSVMVPLYDAVPVTLTNDITASGSGQSDVDLVRVALNAGQRLDVDLDAAQTEFDSSLSGLLASVRIFSLSGVPQQTVSNQAIGVDPNLYFVAPATGTYLVGVSSIGNATYDPAVITGRTTNSSSGQYQLHLMKRSDYSQASQNVITVNTKFESPAGDGITSLREALAMASTFAGTSLIEFALPVNDRSIELLSGPLSLTGKAIMRGPSSGSLISIGLGPGAATSRLLHVTSTADLTTENIVFSGGNTTGDGGAILLEGQLRTFDTEINGSTAARGGAVFIGAQGSLSMTRTTVASNRATSGGAIYISQGGRFVATSSTLAMNDATVGADAVENLGDASVYATTIANNGLATTTSTKALVNSATGRFALRSSLVANNLGNADTQGVFTSHGYNLISNAGDAIGFSVLEQLRDQVGGIDAKPPIDAKIGKLALQGGRTRTMMLRGESPAMDASSSFGMPSGDQRGASRMLDGLDFGKRNDTRQNMDIGATEFGTYFVNTGNDEIDLSPIGDGIVDSGTSPTSVTITLRGAVQELSALAGWNGQNAPSPNQFEGIVLIETYVSTIQLSRPGKSEDNSITGDLDVYGNVTVKGNNLSSSVWSYIVAGTSVPTTINGGWRPANILQGPTPLEDRMFHVLPSSSLKVKDLYLTATTLTGTWTGDKLIGGRGGIILNDNGTLEVTRSNLNGLVTALPYNAPFKATLGGAIYSVGGNTTISDTLVTNSAGSKGGGIYLESGNLLLNQESQVVNNYAATDGAGIYAESGTVVVDSSHVDQNRIVYTGTGAGISIQSMASVSVQSSSTINGNTTSLLPTLVVKNEETVSGIGVFNAGNFTLSGGSSISENTNPTGSDTSYQVRLHPFGTAIHNVGTATLKDSFVVGSIHLYYSGQGREAAYNGPTGRFTIVNTQFTKHTARESSSGIRNVGGEVTIQNSIFDRNYSQYADGAISNEGINARLNISDSIFRENGGAQGSAITNLSGTVRISGSQFVGNSADFPSEYFGPSAIMHLGVNEYISAESLDLIALRAEVNATQTRLYTTSVRSLFQFPLPLRIQIEKEVLFVTQIDEYTNSIVVERPLPVSHPVSAAVLILVDDRQTRITVGDPNKFRKYNLPFDIAINQEAMTVIGIEGNQLIVDRGRNGSQSQSHLYPFTEFAIGGSLTILNSTFSANLGLDGGGFGPAGSGNKPTEFPSGGESIYTFVHPFARETIIENTTFIRNLASDATGIVGGADIRTESWRYGTNNPTILRAYNEFDYNSRPDRFPMEDFPKRPTLYLANNVFFRRHR